MRRFPRDFERRTAFEGMLTGSLHQSGLAGSLHQSGLSVFVCLLFVASAVFSSCCCSGGSGGGGGGFASLLTAKVDLRY